MRMESREYALGGPAVGARQERASMVAIRLVSGAPASVHFTGQRSACYFESPPASPGADRRHPVLPIDLFYLLPVQAV
jgi:hypothetical protein